METLLWLLAVQGVLGAFDMFYHHELKEKLPWRHTAAREMLLHGVRNLMYAWVFFSLGWVAWQGALAYWLVGIVAAEVLITLWDFVEEDRTRKLPSTERVTHAILTLNYGAILLLFTGVVQEWATVPTGFAWMYHGLLSWLMALYALGVFVWGCRDFLRGIKLMQPQPAPMQLPALNKPYQHILVTGGTGFVGKRLCKHLIAEGHDVTILTRNIKNAAEHFRGRVTLVESLDLIPEDARFDIIIGLAGEAVAQRWTAKARKRIVESRIEDVRQVATLIKRLKHKPEVYIRASAIGWYGTDATLVFDETSQPSPAAESSFAYRVCAELERETATIAALGIRTCIVRIGLVVEKDGGPLRELLIPFDCCVGGPMGHGQQWWSWIHRDDLVALMIHLINTPEASGIYNGTAPEPVTNRDFAHALGKAMHRPAFAPLPSFVLRLMLGEVADEVMLEGQKVLPTRTLQSGFQFMYPEIKGAFAAIFPSAGKSCPFTVLCCRRKDRHVNP